MNFFTVSIFNYSTIFFHSKSHREIHSIRSKKNFDVKYKRFFNFWFLSIQRQKNLAEKKKQKITKQQQQKQKKKTRTHRSFSSRFKFLKTRSTIFFRLKFFFRFLKIWWQLKMITTIRKLSIMQYNVHKFKNQMIIFCFRNQTVKNFHVITIQKLWFNFYFDTTHHSLKNNHHLIFSNFQKMKKSKIRMCMFVIKNISFSSLNFIYRIENLITIKIKLHQIKNIIHYFQLHNIYNEFDIVSYLILI